MDDAVLIVVAVALGVGLQLTRVSTRSTWPLWAAGVPALAGVSLLADGTGMTLWTPLVAGVILAATELMADRRATVPANRDSS